MGHVTNPLAYLEFSYVFLMDQYHSHIFNPFIALHSLVIYLNESELEIDIQQDDKNFKSSNQHLYVYQHSQLFLFTVLPSLQIPQNILNFTLEPISYLLIY